MKALLVNIDLMVRVVVPDDATEEQINDATIERARFVIDNDPYVISEGIVEVKPDTEIPYGESPNDKP